MATDTIQKQGYWRDYTVAFVPGATASITVSSNRPVTLEVYNVNGTLRTTYHGRNGGVTWTPAAGYNPFTIRVVNDGAGPNTFEVYTN